MPLLLLFILVPVIEIWVLISVGSVIGAFPTILLILSTAFIGLALLRQQGFSTLFRMQQRMQMGEVPAGEVIEGVVLAVGGALLLTPGFVTDAIGFLCLIPVTRQAMIKRALAGGIKMQGASNTIEGEYRREKE